MTVYYHPTTGYRIENSCMAFRQLTRLKDRGNALFRRNRFEEAITVLSEAITVGTADDANAPAADLSRLYSNRSACHLKLKAYEPAAADARRCIDLDPFWSKGFYRLGMALEAAGFIFEAHRAFAEGLIVDPGNAELRKRVSIQAHLFVQPDLRTMQAPRLMLSCALGLG